MKIKTNFSIQDDFLTVSEWTRPGVERKETRGITLHYSGWLGIPCRAKNTRDFFESIPHAAQRVAWQAKADWEIGITDGCDTLQKMTLKRLWANSIYAASSNYVIGLPEEIREGRGILRLMPTREKSYTSGWFQYSPLVFSKLLGNPNESTIGIEIAAIDGEGRFAPETYEQTIALCASLCLEFNLTAEDIYRHYDMCAPGIIPAPKLCPLWYVNHPEDWRKLKEDVARRI